MNDVLVPVKTPVEASKPAQEVIRIGRLFGLADQIQALCLAHKTAEIRVVNVVPAGCLHIFEGDVVHAQFGNRTGLEAAIALINLRDPETEIHTGLAPANRTIHLGFVHILLEAAGRKDETMYGQYQSVEAEVQLAEPTLQIMLPNHALTITIKHGLTLVGRSPFNDIVITHETISKRHASIAVSHGGVLIRDLGSTNGTFVDGQPISDWHLIGVTNLRFGDIAACFTPGNSGRE